MNKFPRQPARFARLSAAGIFLLLLSGCGDDRPVSDPPPGGPGAGYSAPTPVALAPAPAAAIPDPLLSGAGAAGSADPMAPSDPLLHHDPLAQSDPLQGHAMPTDHSHWLRGRVQGGRLTVLLNGIRQGVYSGVVDQDITMKLRAGLNSVTFLYIPSQAGSLAQMDLLESEHDPPIPPLVMFQSRPLSRGTTDFQPTTQRFTFFAK